MTTILTALLVAAALAMCALRAPGPDDRTPREMATAVRRAGWARTALAGLRVTVVLVLLLLVEAARLCWHTAAAIGALLTILAYGIESLSCRAHLEGAAR